MIYNYISVKNIIAKVFTDLDLQEETHRISDWIEWVGEAIKRISAYGSFVKKITGKGDVPIITFSNYQAELPHDLFRVIQVAYGEYEDGPFYPMRYATGSFEGDWRSRSSSTSTYDSYLNSDLISLAMLLYNLSYSEALTQLNDGTIDKDLLITLVENNTSSTSDETADVDTGDLVYTINDNYLNTNIESGYLMVSYEAIKTDAEGYPMIPNNESFREAIYWYIVMKLLYPKWLMGKVRDLQYFEAKRSWNFYSKQAYANSLLFTRDQAESIKNTFNRLVPEMTEHDTGYSHIGKRQVIYNAN